MGSVKDLRVVIPPSPKACGIGSFFFSDRYSVFDWGEMPDHIPHKGESLCLLSAHFFELLKKKGIPSHYLGVGEKSSWRSLKEVQSPSREMKIKLVQVIRPQERNGGYDYSAYQHLERNFLLPFEIIFRNALPAGSSARRRLETGELTLDQLGLKKMPVPDERLPFPYVELTTKLEASDRSLTWQEAKNILPFLDMEKVKALAIAVNELLTQEAEKAGLFLQDGKIELALDEHREMIIVDTLGTLDECRFVFQNLPISKEVARDYYRRTSWYRKIQEAKAKSSHWKDHVPPPPALPSELVNYLSLLYQSATNALTGREYFAHVPGVVEVAQELHAFLRVGS